MVLASVLVMLFSSCDKSEDEQPDCGCNEKYGSFTDSRDGYVYKTIEIGDQTWMAENLAYLPEVNAPDEYSEIQSKYYVYEYNGSNVSKAKAIIKYQTFGVLYNWPAAIKSCPEGWHLPSDEEWTILEEFLIANGYNYDGTTTDNKIAKALAAAYEWGDFSSDGAIGNNISLNNRSCFSALPGGLYGIGMDFSRFGNYGYWWSSTVSDEGIPFIRELRSFYPDLTTSDMDKVMGASVRCIKD